MRTNNSSSELIELQPRSQSNSVGSSYQKEAQPDKKEITSFASFVEGVINNNEEKCSRKICKEVLCGWKYFHVIFDDNSQGEALVSTISKMFNKIQSQAPKFYRVPILRNSERVYWHPAYKDKLEALVAGYKIMLSNSDRRAEWLKEIEKDYSHNPDVRLALTEVARAHDVLEDKLKNSMDPIWIIFRRNMFPDSFLRKALYFHPAAMLFEPGCYYIRIHKSAYNAVAQCCGLPLEPFVKSSLNRHVLFTIKEKTPQTAIITEDNNINSAAVEKIVSAIEVSDDEKCSVPCSI